MISRFSLYEPSGPMRCEVGAQNLDPSYDLPNIFIFFWVPEFLLLGKPGIYSILVVCIFLGHVHGCGYYHPSMATIDLID